VLYAELFNTSLRKFKGETGNSRLDIEVLIRAAFNLSKTGYWVKKNEVITDKRALGKFYRWRSRLLKDEPPAYITGQKESYSRDFYVNKSVLIPRPETEILIEAAILSIKKMENPVNVLDIGTGSGIIAVNIAVETGAKVIAVDKSRGALSLLKKNIARHNVKDKVIPLCADLFPRSGKDKKGPFDLIVSNPPYVTPEEWRALPLSIKNYEPEEAFVAMEGGLAIIRRIAEEAKKYLKPGGKILLEIGCGQKEKVKKILQNAGFANITFIEDYSHIPRTASAVL
jgi:release factor glutamine methyltransferase